MGIKRYRVKCEYNIPWLEEHHDGNIIKLSDHLQVVKELEGKIKELKNVIGGEYIGYYCAEHGAINGVEVTYHERCAICGRDANHQPKEQD